MTHINKAYHYFYKITNKINGMFYYGIHSTNNLDDGYMGSGKRLHYAYKKYGKENFVKEIIKFFDTFEELSNYEEIIVNEKLLNDPKCYNLIKGGYYVDENSLIKLKKTLKERKCHYGKNNSQYGKCWITKNGINKSIHSKELDNYISLGWVKGRKIKVTDKIIKANSNRIHLYKNDKTVFISKDSIDVYLLLLDGWNIGRKPTNKKKRPSTEEYVEYRKQSYENFKNSIRVRDKDGNEFVVKKDDPRYLSGELVYYAKGKILVKNCNNRIYVDVNDPRYLSGELLPVCSSKNRVTLKDINGNYLSVYKDDE